MFSTFIANPILNTGRSLGRAKLLHRDAEEDPTDS